jgi:hypothetical protein
MVLFNWWGLGKLDPGDPGYVSLEESVMTLSFDGFQISVLFIAIIVRHWPYIVIMDEMLTVIGRQLPHPRWQEPLARGRALANHLPHHRRVSILLSR